MLAAGGVGVAAVVVVTVAGDDSVVGVEAFEGAGGGDNTGGVIVAAAAVGPRLQHEPSLPHHKAKPRMESRHCHERGRERWMDRKERDRERVTHELGRTCQDRMRNHHAL